MAITQFLIQSRLSNLLAHNNNVVKRNYSPYIIVPTSPKNTMMICFNMNHKTEFEKVIIISRNNNSKKVTSKSDIDIYEVIKNVIKVIHKPVIITGVVLLSMLFLNGRRYHVLAASGGDMGGSSFSSSGYDDDDDLSSDDDYKDMSVLRTQSVNEPDGRVSMVILAILFASYLLLHITSKTSVIKLQVGLLGSARSLQRDFNRIAKTADTSTLEGLTYILQEATTALLRHPDYCISGYSSVDVEGSIEECQKLFNKLTSEERDKFDELTLVNVNNIRKQSATSRISNGVCNEYIVVTIIVAASGVHELPPINSSAHLKEALHKLSSIPSNKIKGVEVLWTPQMENDTLSKKELIRDYPLLHPL